MTARNLLAGRGLTIPWGAWAGQPVSHFPPLFPLVLAAIGSLGLDPWDAARYLNALDAEGLRMASPRARLRRRARARRLRAPPARETVVENIYEPP